MSKTIGIIVGSLREGSYNRLFAQNVIDLLPAGYETKLLEIGNLPLYNEDVDQDNPPAEYSTFREQLEQCDAFLFVTPEYNRSLPAAMKNALDVGSRPYGFNKFAGKPGAIISVTIGRMGAFGANHHLRQVLVFLDVPVLQQPEMYISNAADLIDKDGRIADSTLKLLKNFVDAFVQHIERY